MMNSLNTTSVSQTMDRKRPLEEKSPLKGIEIGFLNLTRKTEDKIVSDEKVRPIVKNTKKDQSWRIENCKVESLQLDNEWSLETRFQKPTVDDKKTVRGHKRRARFDFNTLDREIIHSIYTPSGSYKKNSLLLAY
jgi:hypothetical protein